MNDGGGSLDAQMRELRARADDDFVSGGPRETGPGSHTADIAALGLRVTLTRSRYPNTADGDDQYAVTVTRHDLDHAPAEPEVREVLTAAFGDTARLAVERRGGPVVRMFRVPAGS